MDSNAMSEEKSITKDLRLLPSTDDIVRRINDDANKIAEEIQDKLIEGVSESVDGRAFIEHNIPMLYEDKVKSILKSWAKMQSYKLDIYQGKIKLSPKGLKFLEDKIELCDKCKNKFSHTKTNIVMASMALGSLGISAGSSYALITTASWGGWTVASFAFTGLLSWLVGFGMGNDQRL